MERSHSTKAQTRHAGPRRGACGRGSSVGHGDLGSYTTAQRGRSRRRAQAARLAGPRVVRLSLWCTRVRETRVVLGCSILRECIWEPVSGIKYTQYISATLHRGGHHVCPCRCFSLNSESAGTPHAYQNSDFYTSLIVSKSLCAPRSDYSTQDKPNYCTKEIVCMIVYYAACAWSLSTERYLCLLRFSWLLHPSTQVLAAGSSRL